MEKHQLSKSTFIRGVQCLKSLYLYKNRYFLRDRLSPEQMAKFKRGTDVGIFAQNLFPGGIDCKPKSPSQYRKSVEKTAEVISEGSHDVIYEAAFQYDRVLILLDILVKQNGKWNAYEVKSSLKISETYLLDAALQYYVLTSSGIDIDRFFLVHINPDYVFEDELNINNLFTFSDVTDKILTKQEFVKTQIEAEKEAIALKKPPPIDIGPHCRDPYPCDFIGHCWKHVPEKPVFGLSFFSDEEKWDFYQSGKVSIDSLSPDDFDDFVKRNELICRRESREFFDAEKFAEIMSGHPEPFVFTGFLGLRQAIPKWKNYQPYDLIPLSCSLISDKSPTGQHFFNGLPEIDPDETFIRFLDQAFKDVATIITYESQRFIELIRRLKIRNPQSESLLDEIENKVFDAKSLLDEFVFFHPGISAERDIFSLGKILPDTGNLKKPFFSDTLAMIEYQKQSAKTLFPESFNDFTLWKASLIKEFIIYLNNKSK